MLSETKKLETQIMVDSTIEEAHEIIKVNESGLAPGHCFINGFITSTPSRTKTLRECLDDYLWKVALGS